MVSATSPLTQWTMIARSLRYFSRSHLAVALGIAAATAVIVGALVVGDSVRSSLRGLVLDRLGKIECVLHSRNFFGVDLVARADQLAQQAETLAGEYQLAPLILLPNSSVESRSGEQFRRGAQVQVLAVDQAFWKGIGTAPASLPGDDEVALNAALARELGVDVGDEITLRLAVGGGVPAESPLGKRESNTESLPRQKVVAILPDEGIGGISFAPNQTVPRNVYASLKTVQDLFEREQQANAILVFSAEAGQRMDSRGADFANLMNESLLPRLEDYGLKLEHHVRRFPDPEIDGDGAPSEAESTIYDYYQLSSSELLIDNATSAVVTREFEEVRPIRLMTYLANTLVKVEGPLLRTETPREAGDGVNIPPSRRGFGGPFGTPRAVPAMGAEEMTAPALSVGPVSLMGQRSTKLLSREVPYSIVVGVDSKLENELRTNYTIQLSELRAPTCWINSWLADQVQAAPGDWIEMRFYEPETVDGNEVEKAVQMFVAGVVPVTQPSEPYRRNRPAKFARAPTLFNDPNLTPMVPGVTDQESISNWDLPFDLKDEELILPIDDEYWNEYRLTPKLFMTYRTSTSRYFFSSRFGQTTAFRWPAEQVTGIDWLRAKIESALQETKNSQGLTFTPVRMEQLRAASGTTPFDMLFLSLSFFVIVAALMLVSLLFRLGLQQRTGQLGLLLAQGLRPQLVQRLMLGELAIVAAVGAAVGIGLGLLYARVMIAGLETWWIGAITTRFLRFEFTWLSLLIGAVAGILASLLTIHATLRKLNRARPLAWIRGSQESIGGRDPSALRMIWMFVAGVLAIAAGVLMFAGVWQSGMARAGSFFGSGMLLLAAALLATRHWLSTGTAADASKRLRNGLGLMAVRSISRNPARSSLAIGLLAVASFLIASMGVFQVRPDERGYGGFDLLAESAQPIYRNLGSMTARRQVLGSRADQLRGTTIIPMRERRGADASCNNLFQVTQPTILAVPSILQEVYDLAASQKQFDWAATTTPERPWEALQSEAAGTPESPIPVVLDQNTAAWSLKQGAQLGSIVQLDYEGRTLHFKTVGLLSNSVLQGKLLVSESNFVRAFPELSGYSFFLIRTADAAASPGDIIATLEEGWSDSGMDVTVSADVLEQLLGVQNTYISAFQSLGALGLLLGTFGLVAAQIRSVVERRRELALMQAVGFSSRRIGWMVALETALLLGGGMLVGCVCASLALVPYVVEVGPQLSLFNPLVMLAIVFVTGFGAGLLAVWTATRQSVLSGLRTE